MTSPPQFPIRALHDAVSQVLGRVTEGADPVPHVRHDAYWAVSPQERFDMSAVPRPTVGRVTEELEHLDEVLADPDLPPGIALVWLGRLLECLGTELLADDADERG